MACIAFAALVGTACKQRTPPKGATLEPGPPQPAQARGVLQVQFAHGAEAPGCQLHLLEAQGRGQLAVELGDTRRRAVFPRGPGYFVRPARFPAAIEDTRLQLELHTTLPWSPMVAAWPPSKTGQRISGMYRQPLPKSWAFACVIRRPRGTGHLVLGLVRAGEPRLEGQLPLPAGELDARAIRRRLERLLARP